MSAAAGVIMNFPSERRAADVLYTLWDLLEARGATVRRAPLDDVRPSVIARLIEAESRRLEILCEAELPGPSPYRPWRRD